MVGPNSPKMSLGHPDMPMFMGKIDEYDKFDSQFFKVPYLQSKFMEPYNRKLLEEAYSAIFDAGVNPLSMSGERIGVFIGSSFADQSMVNLFVTSPNSPYLITGCSKAMLANRISYWINSKAASYVIDQNNASSTVCLKHAYWAIKSGICDAAIVGGCNQCLRPILSVNLKRAGLLTLDGKTKCFDKNGDGYVRSEACGTIFLQKAKDAKRIYCEVYYVKEKFFASPSGDLSIVYKSEDLEKFLHEFYNDIDVSPDMVEYIEANAIGIAEADRNELQAISNFFAKNKNVKVGSVNSNMGHGEAASGLCSLIKICLAYHTGKLPANLHYYEPQDNIPAIKDGRIQVVVDNLPFKRGFVALNSFSYGGVNVHVLLKSFYKAKDTGKYRSSIPRLVLASARSESGVNKITDYLKNKPIDPEEIALLHNFYSYDVSNHTARGYVVLNTNKNNETVASSISTQLYNGVKRPVWFIYSGMGSQWLTMGASLMRIPVFAAAIERCRAVLEPRGVDIIRILTKRDKSIFDNILNSFVGISAMQIGLTDVLKTLEIIPDNLIGHSLGELGCAYADGCLTAEEMILASYYRGLVSIEAELPKGAMAAVGLGYKNVCHICPPEIDVACHNSSESCTISGPYEDVKKFIAQLNSRGIFAKEVYTWNIAYHSRYIAQLGDKLLVKMKEILTTPKLRSKKWLATSVPPENWHKPETQYCSAEYFTNNLLSFVYFEEVATRIPLEAIVIEIAPHGLMQAILRRSHEYCIHVPLTRRNHDDIPDFLLNAIGKLYQSGLNPKIEALYPKVTFPVSTETPILSHLVEWEHQENWLLRERMSEDLKPTSSREIFLSVHEDKWSFIKEHVRDGIAAVPEAAILFLVWESLGLSQGINYKNLSVCFTNVKFKSAINAVMEDALRININILKGSGKFEVTWKDVIISTGYIHASKVELLHDYVNILETEECDKKLNSNDVYTIMNLRGHSYGLKMQTIDWCNLKRNKAQVKWNGEWIVFLDALLQLGALSTDYTDVAIPVYINKLFIDTAKHKESDDGKYNVAVMGNDEKIIRSDNIEIHNIVFQRKPMMKGDDIVPQNLVIKKTNDPIYSNQENDYAEEMKLTSMGYGDFDKLYWTTFKDTKSDTSLEVFYAGISIRDWYKIMGSKPECDSFGMYYSGINKRNERVMGVVSSGAMATSVEPDSDLLWPVPEDWSLEDAATVPMPYLLAYYVLTIRIKIQKHHSILIMDGATPIGQAFISICLDLGCNVFTAVSNFEKKKLLLEIFPNLKENNTIDYSTTEIKPVISANNTKSSCNILAKCGYGVPLETEIRCIDECGILLHFIEDPKSIEFGMDVLNLSRSLCLVHLPNVFKPDHLHERKLLQRVIGEGIARGVVRPLQHVVFRPPDVSKAFQLFSSDKFIGQVLVDMKTIQKHHLCALPRITAHPKEIHIIINDASDLGLLIVDKLVNRGARNLVLHCTTQSGYLQYKLDSWENSGVFVTLCSDELLDKNSCITFIEKSKTKGPVHSIFVVETMKPNYTEFYKIDKKILRESDILQASIVDNLDEVSSELCPGLRSFVVIALTPVDKNDRILFERQKTCQLRRQRGLPSIVFQIELSNQQTDNIEKLLINTSAQQLSSMVKSLELAMEYGRDDIFKTNNEQPFVNFKKKLTKILGIKNDDEYVSNKTLKDLGITTLLLKEINILINTVYGFNYAPEQLQNKTVQSLLKIDDGYETEVKTGLNALFSYIDDDEYRASDAIVVMPTDQMTFKEKIEIDSTRTYLWMVPGLEGHHEVFTSLCSAVNIQTVTLQIGLEIQEDCIPQMAARIMKNLKQTFNLKTKFYLLGYSFGVNLALELASLIEKEGHTGVVFCLDSSPDALKVQMDEYIGEINEEDLQNVIIEHMYCVFSGRNKDDISTEISNIDDWTAKIAFCIKKLKCFVNHSHEYMKCIIQCFYNKIIAGREYKPNYKLQSQLVLLKGSLINRTALAEDYGLSKYSVQPVRVFNIEKDIVSIPHDYKVASIINKMLESHILEESEK
ncbi:hypothetical protein O3G_MSEX007050 [Manduca sexta]|uniref:Ketosynthase family 3 (KS3) domain-containing protein n=2 Tax=Manduca sexta TaxID=7130 RepID=A0A921Z4R1_MANSE|nr:hypothetical protein O3G_MSEX007050 [Manduca sexta]